MGRPFSGEEDREIARRFAAGESIEGIAEGVGRSYAATTTYMTRTGLVGRKGLGHGVRERILERIAEGWRPSRVARQHGLRVEVVERIVVEAFADAEGRLRQAEDERRRVTVVVALAREIAAERRAA